ncbi:hypothetical protein, unlikely [Trypanosoma brucei brucei TREU927]|uniref:Uncharacterized protein n=1 Tax=Trypanosoma brucei brucei (strain 927/4 GUTat10.1) TaxID=185431 RepID=Q38FC5_TRYB2|nr:hypothetical protein, unlikely [Trypanosoma brucei brucei TREU927]EAN76495.1 hypothetical protein, unlikely [Trypanosoma brucei brucei TREU927]
MPLLLRDPFLISFPFFTASDTSYTIKYGEKNQQEARMKETTTTKKNKIK